MKALIAALMFVFGTAMIVLVINSVTGAGSFKRMLKVSGVYSVSKPDGYDVVCFLDADSRNGGLSCLPLALAKKEAVKCTP